MTQRIGLTTYQEPEHIEQVLYYLLLGYISCSAIHFLLNYPSMYPSMWKLTIKKYWERRLQSQVARTKKTRANYKAPSLNRPAMSEVERENLP